MSAEESIADEEFKRKVKKMKKCYKAAFKIIYADRKKTREGRYWSDIERGAEKVATATLAVELYRDSDI